MKNNLFTFKPLVAITFFLIISLLLLLNSQDGLAAPTVTVTTPSAAGVTVAEMDEFATDVFGDPWDMNEVTDLEHYRNIANSTFEDGIYSANLNVGGGNERIILLSAGAINNTALRTGKIGYNFPIDADKYRYLTFRLYKSCTNCNSGYVQWFADDTYTNAVMGAAQPYSMPSPAGWHTVTVDLKGSPLWRGEKNWSGTIRELIIHPFSGPVGAEVRFDWARLTTKDPRTSRPYTINWTGGNGTHDIYLSPGDKVLSSDDILVESNVDANPGSYTMQTGVFPSGSYYIGLDTDSGVVWSPGKLTVNSAPQVTILKPSKTSGEEFAQSVLGNAWDMSDSTDLNDVSIIDWNTCVANPSFSGIYRATITACPISNGVFTDARFILGNMHSPDFDATIDTQKYRYLSFRYKLEGEQDVAHGWIARFGWSRHGEQGQKTEATVMSRDIILYEGWNTYKLDLQAADIIDENHPVKQTWQDSKPNRLRFDPAELYLNLLPKDIELDWIKLTAMDEVKRGDTFPIDYELSAADDVELTFYYDTDTNPDNGRSLIGTHDTKVVSVTDAVEQLSPSAESKYFVYLPLVVKNPYSCIGDCFAWNTATVNSGTYFVCIESEDAYNSTYRCSESPVVVTP